MRTGQLITNCHVGGGMRRMTDRGRADSLVGLHHALLEHEARLKSLLESLVDPEWLQEPSTSMANEAAEHEGDVRLTEHEVQILQLVVWGHTNQQIGAQLQLIPGVIRNRLSQIYWKLGVVTRTHAAVRAVELGLCSVGSSEASR